MLEMLKKKLWRNKASEKSEFNKKDNENTKAKDMCALTDV